jgi:hypothetical protein
MGGYIGPTAGMSITASSPGFFVRLAGWILLALPGLFIIL